ncbi:unnamed protein product [Lactuca virosa]|uniref:Uncharacterized protein n=1 Tax=Lactuca virosa TaxID=75947 RepID=A0AAU9LUJ1_9ASTR|nr:unnamed protein product [Lactuca virosa]
MLTSSNPNLLFTHFHHSKKPFPGAMGPIVIPIPSKLSLFLEEVLNKSFMWVSCNLTRGSVNLMWVC